MKYTEEVAVISEELGVAFSVAMDIHYLRSIEKRIVEAAKSNPETHSFPVYNEDLETQLTKLEQK